jgi:hypothetical protein
MKTQQGEKKLSGIRGGAADYGGEPVRPVAHDHEAGKCDAKAKMKG